MCYWKVQGLERAWGLPVGVGGALSYSLGVLRCLVGARGGVCRTGVDRFHRTGVERYHRKLVAVEVGAQMGDTWTSCGLLTCRCTQLYSPAQKLELQVERSLLSAAEALKKENNSNSCWDITSHYI